ncbi:Rossmann-like and DUF2520 domain-containing protein [Niabella drilacis]|uniref:Predicted oxidoreductase, contains short-chain dehydrogenase (SDR) and DUF2520 domains n=1 Tax=Niabella drilacis (strain DSM 25811 / CCM 8410 / CCUG 62505 / LMG 26954 / E90) TaxID=1285928 RepID=A0A1G6WS67_NIADE|nr:Rossmann-like and DUF2520 domain-containing protein [Niabella drilacis]SDD68654.1 Predicted oxidoreductase, contains short-chain dehydrogenase (SDR) and DUF2520 domains [Niabella drilacis]
MNIVILGSGNVAAVLGRKLRDAGHEILQVYGRNASAASELAYEWNTESTNYTSLISRAGDVYLVAVSDAAIAPLAADLRLNGKVVVHTAAAVPMEVLKEVTDNYGVFYPLQSMRKQQEKLPELSIYTEASNEPTQKVLDQLAASVTGKPAHAANLDKRARLHVAAVFASNFTNYLFDLAASFCSTEGIDFQELLPLIRNTVDRLEHELPSRMQTGPAIRGDMDTIGRHRELLKAYPEHLAVYNFLTEALMKH